MKDLILKDWRAARVLKRVAILLFVAPFAVALAWILTATGPEWPKGLVEWAASLAALVGLSCISSSLATTLAPAVLIAKERRDRTASFVASMPVSRSQVILAKIIISVTVLAIPALVALVAFALGGWIVGRTDSPLMVRHAEAKLVSMQAQIAWAGSVGILNFGLAWLFSSVLRNDLAAAGASFCSCVAIVVATVPTLTQYYLYETFSSGVLQSLFIALGGICFGVGIICSIWRGTP